MPNPLIRFVQFVRANGGVAAVSLLALRKVREQGPLYALRAICSNLSPVPRFPERRYAHYIARHEHAHHARLLAHTAGSAVGDRIPIPTVLLIVCGDARDGAIGGRDRGRKGGSLPRSEPGRQNRPDRIDPNRVGSARCNRPDSPLNPQPSTLDLPPNWRAIPLATPPSAEALNAALRDGTEHYAAILWPGDRLAPDAAAIVNAALGDSVSGVLGSGCGRASQGPADSRHSTRDVRDAVPALHSQPFTIHHSPFSSPALLYSDEDRLDNRGRRCRPHFKPGWSPDTLLDWPYTGNLCLFDRQAARDADGFCADFHTPDALLYDLVLRLTERDPHVCHIPAVLYRRHTGQRRGEGAAPYLADAPARATAEKPTTQLGRAVPARRVAADLVSAELTEARRRAAARRGIPVAFEEAPAAVVWSAVRPDLGFAPLLALPRLRPLPPAQAEAGAEGRHASGGGGPVDRIDPIDRSDWIDSSQCQAKHGAPAPTLNPQHSTLNPQPSTIHLPPPPLISLIIPTRNHCADLSACIASILGHTTYPRLEILVVDNGSDDPETLRYLTGLQVGLRTAAEAAVPVRVLRLEIPFNFSILNNRAAAEAAGGYLLFLNNDTEVVTPDWIERLLGHAAKPWAGAVGATLLYPDGTLQHAGVATVGLGPTHLFGRLPADYPHPRCQRDGNWSAVTAACMLVSADKFRAVGGFDESLAVAFNDVDLCYRLLERGWYPILATQARLVHHEFKSRGHDRATAATRARMLDELDRLFARWPKFRADPFYNPALSASYPDFLPRG